jgi:flavorubredoxin
MVVKKIEEVLSFQLPLSMICPSHGVIWKDNPAQIVEQYLTWAKDYQENQITIIYDSMWNATRKMAEAIAYGIEQADSKVKIKIMNSAKEDKNDIITEIFKSKSILVGSPTVNNGYLYSLGGLLEMVKGLKFKKKSAAAFGSYGWSGEAVKQISDSLKEAGFTVGDEGLRLLWVPDESGLATCSEYGKSFVEKL